MHKIIAIKFVSNNSRLFGRLNSLFFAESPASPAGAEEIPAVGQNTSRSENTFAYYQFRLCEAISTNVLQFLHLLKTTEQLLALLTYSTPNGHSILSIEYRR